MTKSNNKINQKNTQMAENQHITKKLSIVEELEYQFKIAKAIEIVEKEAINPICLYTDLTGEKITLGGNRNRFTIDNLKHFKELYTIVYDKKINKMNTHTQKEDFRSDFVLNSIINDVEIKGQRKTIAYYGAKAEIQRKNEYKLSTIRVRNSSTQNY